MSLRRQAAFWIAALAGLLAFLWLLRDILLPFIMGMGLAYVLDPVADRLERHGLSRFWATLAILLTALLFFALALFVLVPVLGSQLAAFLARLPAYVARLQELADQVFQTRLAEYLGGDPDGTVNKVVGQATAWAGAVIGSIWAGGLALVNLVSLVVVTPVVAFYLVYDWNRMMARLDSLLPRDHADTIRDLGRQIDRAMAGFLRGQGAVCLILGAFYAVALTLIGLNFGFLIGCIAGVVSFIPFVGTIIGFVLSVGVALVQFWPDWMWVAAVVGIFAAGQFLEGNILQPRLVGASIGVHPVWLMFALFAFGSLFGFVGVLLAVPLAAAVGVLARFLVEQYRQSRVYWGAAGPPPSVGASGEP